jgi:hypothetical protein
MADTEISKDIASDKQKVRLTENEEIVVDMDDNVDIVLSTKAPKRPSKSKAVSCGSKMVGEDKII